MKYYSEHNFFHLRISISKEKNTLTLLLDFAALYIYYPFVELCNETELGTLADCRRTLSVMLSLAWHLYFHDYFWAKNSISKCGVLHILVCGTIEVIQQMTEQLQLNIEVFWIYIGMKPFPSYA